MKRLSIILVIVLLVTGCVSNNDETSNNYTYNSKNLPAIQNGLSYFYMDGVFGDKTFYNNTFPSIHSFNLSTQEISDLEVREKFKESTKEESMVMMEFLYANDSEVYINARPVETSSSNYGIYKYDIKKDSFIRLLDTMFAHLVLDVDNRVIVVGLSQSYGHGCFVVSKEGKVLTNLSKEIGAVSSINVKGNTLYAMNISNELYSINLDNYEIDEVYDFGSNNAINGLILGQSRIFVRQRVEIAEIYGTLGKQLYPLEEIVSISYEGKDKETLTDGDEIILSMNVLGDDLYYTCFSLSKKNTKELENALSFRGTEENIPFKIYKITPSGRKKVTETFSPSLININGDIYHWVIDEDELREDKSSVELLEDGDVKLEKVE